MPRICVVGTPAPLGRRFEAAANQRGAFVVNVITAIGKEGWLEFRPDRDQAVEALRGFFSRLDDDDLGRVVVLPYTPLHQALSDEIEALSELGTEVIRAEPGVDPWPDQPSRGSLDQAFLDQLFAAMMGLFPGQAAVDLPPSEYFRRIAEQNPRLIIPEGALDVCDEVAKHRYKFMRRAADAFDAFLRDGAGGRIDAHFTKFGLGHAQSGGINATFRLIAATGEELHAATSNTHLKQGDKTTKAAAARIYYQAVEVKRVSYVAVLYAGPHPDNDLTRTHQHAA